MPRGYKNPLKTRFSKEFFSKIPVTSGVYFMKSAKGEVLYIGKAKSLRNRLRSYRNAKPGKVGSNVIKCLERVSCIEWEIHESEQAAFDRELELIRAFVPRYNIADAWEERYLFIGIRKLPKDKIEFHLTYKVEDAKDFQLHGCYPRRSLVKNGYSALLRILFACVNESERFSFPARITRPAPAYEYILKMRDSEKWFSLISLFLHGKKSNFMHLLVERLLASDKIPEYVRPGLQRDLVSLVAFEKLCLKLCKERNKKKHRIVSHTELREEIQHSVRISTTA